MYPAKTAATLSSPVQQPNECPFIIVLNRDCVKSCVHEWRSRAASPPRSHAEFIVQQSSGFTLIWSAVHFEELAKIQKRRNGWRQPGGASFSI